MGSSSFSAMSRLKFESYDWSLLSEHDIHCEEKRMNTIPFLVAVITVIIRIYLLPTIQEIIYWLILAGISISISISKSDVDDGVSLDFP